MRIQQWGNIAWKIMMSHNESLLIKVLWTWCEIQTPISFFITLLDLVSTNLFNLKSYYSPYLSHCSPIWLETQGSPVLCGASLTTGIPGQAFVLSTEKKKKRHTHTQGENSGFQFYFGTYLKTVERKKFSFTFLSSSAWYKNEIDMRQINRRK